MNDIDNTNKNCGDAEVFGELTFEQAAFIRKACEHYSDYLRRKERNSDEAR